MSTHRTIRCHRSKSRCLTEDDMKELHAIGAGNHFGEIRPIRKRNNAFDPTDDLESDELDARMQQCHRIYSTIPNPMGFRKQRHSRNYYTRRHNQKAKSSRRREDEDND